jgi:hypothetical protein
MNTHIYKDIMHFQILRTLLIMTCLYGVSAHTSDPCINSGAKQVLLQAQQHAQSNNLKIVEGNGKKAIVQWVIPAHVRKIRAEGGSQCIQASDRKDLVFELVADENLLPLFSTRVENDVFIVEPKEGLLLISYTPVKLNVLMPNGLVPPMSMKRGDRVISVSK